METPDGQLNLKTAEPTFVVDTIEEEADRATTSSSENSVNSTYALMKPKGYVPTEMEMSSLAFTFPYNRLLNAGSRAFEAFVRPSPIVVAGKPKFYNFDMRSATFTMSMIPHSEQPAEDAPTEIFLPDYLFQDCEPVISTSSGRWVVYRPAQVLRWWHCGSGEQNITITSGYKREGVVGTANDDIEGWYYWNANCRIM